MIGVRAAAGPLVLAVNAGSSSLKFGLYPREGAALWTGSYEGLEPGGVPALKLDGSCETLAGVSDSRGGFDVALAHLLATLTSQGQTPVAVAHRIVHGGERFVAPCRIDEAALAELHRLDTLAPLHQPHNLAGVAAFARALPGVPQIGCFDTAFHACLPAVEQRLPIDRALAAQGLRRYGFHGLSYQYLRDELVQRTTAASGRAVLAHLGNGASVCATQDGASVATSMGFSALDGLMMGTRSGSLDPGVLLHLLAQGWDHRKLERLLYKQSGLKGVSGLSADMRTLRASELPEAAEAIALFTRRLVRELGAMLAVLGGVDLLAFTGGIGEHDALLRAEAVAALGFAGFRLDQAANAAARGDAIVPIHADDSSVEVWVVPTDEGRVAARAAFALLGV
jgi:acetate kinase